MARKRNWLFVSCFIFLAVAHAETLRYIHNPYTDDFDAITVLSSVTLPSGSTNYLRNTNSLQSGATGYPDYLYVQSGATFYTGVSINATGEVWRQTDPNVAGYGYSSYRGPFSPAPDAYWGYTSRSFGSFGAGWIWDTGGDGSGTNEKMRLETTSGILRPEFGIITTTGSVNGQWSVSSLKFPDGTIQVSSPTSSTGGTILNQNTLQSGATYFVSSATVQGPLSVSSVTVGVYSGTPAYRLTVRDPLKISALFYGYSSIGNGSGGNLSDDGNGMIQFGKNAADNFQIHYDDWGQGGNGATYFDSASDSASSAFFVRMRTAGTAVTIFSGLGSGAIGIGAAPAAGYALLVNSLLTGAHSADMYVRGYSPINGSSVFSGSIQMGSYGMFQIDNGLVNVFVDIDDNYDDPASGVQLRTRTAGTALTNLTAWGNGSVAMGSGVTKATVTANGGVFASSCSITAGSSSLIARVGGTIFDHYASTGNTTTVETDLYVDSVTANTLNANGNKLYAYYAGSFVGSTSSKDLKVYFSSTSIFDTGALAISAGGDWRLEVTIIRDTSISLRTCCILNTAGASTTVYTNVSNMGFSSTIGNILKITGTASSVGAATNDVIVKMGYVDFKPTAT